MNRQHIIGLPALIILLILGIGCSSAEQSDTRIAVNPTPWRTADDIIEDWDWSLPPGIEAVPYSGTSMPWPQKDGKRYDLPGNEYTMVRAQWRELEPEEGQYNFEPLRQRIIEAGKEWDGVELHIYGAVWELRDFPDHENADYPPNWLEKNKPGNESAPRWLEKYNIPTIEERPRYNLKTPFHIINLDIYHSDYHSRYLKMVEAFGKSGIPQMQEVMFSYQHTKSGSRGEEGMVPTEEPAATRLKERLAAWGKAFEGVEYKLAYTAGVGPQIAYSYTLGMGQRNGFVEQVINHIPNADLGQLVDENNYLVVDEDLPPIKENRAYGDENEEYTQTMTPRFGPWESFAHRFRESTLRVLQMRRNFVWIEPSMMNPEMTAYLSLELGRNVNDTPDIWCYLRESYPNRHRDANGAPLPVKNFERWLYQRDQTGYTARATAKVHVPEQMQNYHPDHYYDYTARTTDAANGNTAIGFAVDDRFLSGGPHRVAVKVTYHDQGPARWALVYNQGKSRREITCWGHGNVRTATWFLDDAKFDGNALDYDFEIRALEGDAVIKFIRVIRL
jgi:hypothetical protein